MIEPFATRIRFVILMHPKEARKERCGTGRLCHLILENTHLVIGDDFTADPKVNALIADPGYHSVLLFPTPGAIDLSQDGYKHLGHGDRKLQIFVVDGTWRLAGKVIRLSKNLQTLPTVSFIPQQPSDFRFKKQPKKECLSTLESIHFLLQLAQEQGAEDTVAPLAQLPRIFERMVEIQIESQASGKLSVGNG